MPKQRVTLPGGTSLSGTVQAISSKSDLHRLIFCACLADKPSCIRYHSELSKDIEATIDCFRTLGAKIAVKEQRLCIQKPLNFNHIPANVTLFCGESGSTARFLLPLISLICQDGATLTGTGKLPERPFDDLCLCLEAMGAEFSSHKLPITVQKTITPEGFFKISGNVSSQYITGLLFILPLCNALGIQLTTSLESAGYVNLTADALLKYGIRTEKADGIFRTIGDYKADSAVFNAQGDWSNAAFWLCAAKGNDTLTVTGLDLHSSQPDRQILEILESMGMKCVPHSDAVTVSAPDGTRGVCFDAREIPDLVPILALRAAISRGETVISGTARLRLKESDRAYAICTLINTLGGKAHFDDDHIYITGVSSLTGGVVDSFNDHRIAMTAAIASVFSTAEVNIHDCMAVTKSYPLFYKHFEALAGSSLPQKLVFKGVDA